MEGAKHLFCLARSAAYLEDFEAFFPLAPPPPPPLFEDAPVDEDEDEDEDATDRFRLILGCPVRMPCHQYRAESQRRKGLVRVGSDVGVGWCKTEVVRTRP